MFELWRVEKKVGPFLALNKFAIWLVHQEEHTWNNQKTETEAEHYSLHFFSQKKQFIGFWENWLYFWEGFLPD